LGVIQEVSLREWYQNEAQGRCFLTSYIASSNLRKIKKNFEKIGLGNKFNFFVLILFSKILLDFPGVTRSYIVCWKAESLGFMLIPNT
jgi:hypothetical protein